MLPKTELNGVEFLGEALVALGRRRLFHLDQALILADCVELVL